ncbi:hypothetical protein ILYODFUR_016022 [Ilyodon furcidens]|uniref:Uncharacterized protein n=1 Tax=Ilyodon furcidens TaxID=33524 RepID=A0ABV0V471_9TELE
MRSSTDIAALTSPGIIKPVENKLSLPFPACHGTTQRRRISGETKARWRTFFAPQGHSRKILKAGNLSDTRRSEDSYTDRRPRRHPAQVQNPQRFYFQGDEFSSL